MIFHENRLLADESHTISYLIFVENPGNMSPAAVVIGALRVNIPGIKFGGFQRLTYWHLASFNFCAFSI